MKYWMLIFSTLIVGAAQAGGYSHVTNNYYTTNNTFIEEYDGVTDSDLDAQAAGYMAASQINCNTSSTKHQAGFGLGYKNGKNAGAAGYCHALDNNGGDYAHTLGGTVVLMNNEEPAYGVGYNLQW